MVDIYIKYVGWGGVFVKAIVEKQVTCPRMVGHNVSSPSQRPPTHVRVWWGTLLGTPYTLMTVEVRPLKNLNLSPQIVGNT